MDREDNHGRFSEVGGYSRKYNRIEKLEEGFRKIESKIKGKSQEEE